MASIYETIRGVFEARKRTPALTGPYDDKGQLIKLPDPTGIADASTQASSSQPGQTPKDTSRTGRYADFTIMDTGDIAVLLDAVVDSALTFEDGELQCFRLDGTKSNAKNILEETIGLTNLRDKLKLIAHDLLKYGDGFIEVLEDKDGVVSRMQTYYPGQVYVIADTKGNVLGYQQNDVNGQPVAQWKPEELHHFKWEPSDREPYSAASMLDPFRDDWKSLRTLEAGMVLGRTSRAYPRNLHFIDVTNKSTVDANRSVMGYIRALTRQTPTFNYDGSTSLSRTDLQVNEDIFIPTGYVQGADGKMERRLHDVKMLDPNMNGLQNIADIEYVRRKMFATVPAEIVGIGQVDLDTAAQYRAYARVVKKLQAALERGLREMFMHILIIAGITPDNLVFLWPNIISGENWKFQDAKYKQAMTEELEIGAKKHSRRYFLRLEGLTDEEIDEEFQFMKDEQEIFSPIMAPQADPNNPNDNTSSKAAQVAAGSKSGNSVNTPDTTDGPNADKNREAQPKTGTSR